MKRAVMRMRSILAILAMAAALAGVGCGGGAQQATVRYDMGGPEEITVYSTVAYQYAKGEKVQVVMVRRPVAPAGTPEADFEYVYFELPNRDRYGWLAEDKVPVYRWVREAGRDTVWLGMAGNVRESTFGGRETMGFHFEVTMDPLVGDGRPHVFSGAVQMKENVVAVQGFINHYGLQLMALLGQHALPAPVPAPGVKKPATTTPTKSKKNKDTF
jgi:hypothetical protein